MTHPAAPGNIRPVKETVLIADDDRTVVTLLTEYLRKNNFHVVPAFDAMQAMVGVRQTRPKAVILDIGMPGGTGLDVLKKLRAMNTTTQTPIIILTGSTDPKAEQTAMDLGADEFLKKPVDLFAVLSALHRVLGRPEPQRPASQP